MAKAGLIYIGSDDGMLTLSDPGGSGRWRRVGHVLQGQPIQAIVAQSALQLLAATAAELQRSTDGGMSWQPVLAEAITALACDPDRPEQVYALTAAGTVQCSDDGGQHWQPGPPPALAQAAFARHDPAFAAPVSGGDLAGLAASPGRPGMLFAVGQGQIYRTSADGGWQPVQSVPAGLSATGAMVVLVGRQEVVLAVATDGAGHPALLRSEDDGQSWQLATADTAWQGPIAVIAPVAHHRDQAWAATGAGQVFRSDDRGQHWQLVTQGLPPIRSLAPARLI